jgi:hypothetical protein
VLCALPLGFSSTLAWRGGAPGPRRGGGWCHVQVAGATPSGTASSRWQWRCAAASCDACLLRWWRPRGCRAGRRLLAAWWHGWQQAETLAWLTAAGWQHAAASRAAASRLRCASQRTTGIDSTNCAMRRRRRRPSSETTPCTAAAGTYSVASWPNRVERWPIIEKTMTPLA